MRYTPILCLIFLLSASLCHAQDTTGNNKENNSPRHFKGNLQLSVYTGAHILRPAFFDVGVMLNRKAAARHHVAGKAAYLGFESLIRRSVQSRQGKPTPHIYGPKIGFWLSAPTSGLGIGGCAITYISPLTPHPVVALRPEAGLAMGRIMLTYGYNYIINKQNNEFTHWHLLSLRGIIGIAHLNR